MQLSQMLLSFSGVPFGINSVAKLLAGSWP